MKPEYTLQVLHSTEVVVAALSFAGDLARLRSLPPAQPRGSAGPGAAAAAAAAAATATAAAAEAKAAEAARQPSSLSERVLQAFAMHDLPVHKPLSLPTLSLQLACPGAPALLAGYGGLNNLQLTA